MSNTIIRAATVPDIEPLLALINSAYRGEEAKQGWTHEADIIDGTIRTDAETLEASISKPTSTILVVEELGKLLGCVYLEHRRDAVYLGMLSVSPKLQGKGIGKLLLQAADDYAVENGFKKTTMTVISIRKELIDWYQRHGYRVTDSTEPFAVDKKYGTPIQPVHFIVLDKDLAG